VRTRGQAGSGRPAVIAILIVAALAALAWWSTSQRIRPAPRIVTLYGFSALQGVMDEDLLPAFQARWKERTGQHVELVCTWAGSAAIVDRIVREVPVQVAFLASGVDAARLERRGILLGRSRAADAEAFVLARSPLVFCVRAGNPLGIRTWKDLLRPGVEIVHPDPETSGAGEWGVISLWAAAARRAGDTGSAAREVERLWRNVRVRPPSARLALQAFADGQGDVLLTWEKDVLEAVRAGRLEAEVILPPVTGLAEHIMAPIPRNIPADGRELVEELFDYLRSNEVRAKLAERGFRVGPDTAAVADAEMVRLEDLGGANQVERQILDEVWRERIRDTLPAVGPTESP